MENGFVTSEQPKVSAAQNPVRFNVEPGQDIFILVNGKVLPTKIVSVSGVYKSSGITIQIKAAGVRAFLAPGEFFLTSEEVIEQFRLDNGL